MIFSKEALKTFISVLKTKAIRIHSSDGSINAELERKLSGLAEWVLNLGTRDFTVGTRYNITTLSYLDDDGTEPTILSVYVGMIDYDKSTVRLRIFNDEAKESETITVSITDDSE